MILWYSLPVNGLYGTLRYSMVLYGTLCDSMVLWPHECVRRCLLQKAFEPYGAINNVHIVSGKRRACPLAAARHGPIALRARTRSYREGL
jgi:hypothetical protein